MGSHVNLPLYSVSVERLAAPSVVWLFGRAYVVPPTVEPGSTVVAINVGGALIRCAPEPCGPGAPCTRWISFRSDRGIA